MPSSSKMKKEPAKANFFDTHDILMNAPIGVFASTPSGSFVSVNPAFARMFGYDSPESMIRSVTDIGRQIYADPKNRETFKALLQMNGKVDNYECRFCRVDGTEFWGAIHAKQIQGDGKDVGNYYGFVMDITQRKQDEEALLLTQFAMDRAPDSILWVDADGKIAYANDAAYFSLGYSQEELLGAEIFDIDPEFPPERWEQHKADLKKQKRMTFEGLHRTKDGRFFPVEVTTNYIEYKGRFLGIAFDRDVTERKRAEEERRKLQAQLAHAQKMESLGTLAGGVAHDFNNLLQAMTGHVQLLQKDVSETSVVADRLKKMEKSIGRAAQLVKQMLFFSRKSEAWKQPIDLNREVDETVTMLKRTIPRMVDIEAHLDSSLWLINADPTQVEQVLLNLGSNAADAMPDGGKLIIETSNATLDADFTRVHLDAEPGEYVLLSVTDTGIGMDSQILDHAFDPFFTTKEIGKGTGLGLASVYGIVKDHNGHILCYSEPGQGTVFKVYWPALHGVAECRPREALETSAPLTGTETILVVDDEFDVRELTVEGLQACGYTVLAAASGEEAIILYAEKGSSIDVVIMDLGMPGMGGQRCLQELIRMNPTVKVIIASGYTANDSGKNALALGAERFISKPFQLRELAAVVREILG
ncbi:MAG: PAS domain S-box protein [Deltaproteobacteria bacterium]|nr:PAS domain S-box protein [Deltaproteobacteria bacterium]